jgi:hypothetical protein
MAFMSAVGGGFTPLTPGPWYWGTEGVAQGDGTYVTVLAHPDGRTIAIRTKRGDGWQRGEFLHALAGGPWRAPFGGRAVKKWRGVRLMLDNHDPGREEPYCGGPWIRQPRALDGRERDILCRILRDIQRCIGDPVFQRRLLDLIYIDQSEVYRIQEMQAVLDARDD